MALAVITGGGLDRRAGLARERRGAGCEVVLADRDAEALAVVAAEIGRCRAGRADRRDRPAALERLAGAAFAPGPVSLLFNNAGLLATGRRWRSEPSDLAARSGGQRRRGGQWPAAWRPAPDRPEPAGAHRQHRLGRRLPALAAMAPIPRSQPGRGGRPDTSRRTGDARRASRGRCWLVRPVSDLCEPRRPRHSSTRC